MLPQLQGDEGQIPEGELGNSEYAERNTINRLPEGWEPLSGCGGVPYGSFPNPFTSGTKVYFSVPQSGEVSIKVYDVKGDLVRVLVEGRLDAGNYHVSWHGRGDDGWEVASGVYFVRIDVGGREETHRIVVLR